jgi:hypothetical protein
MRGEQYPGCQECPAELAIVPQQLPLERIADGYRIHCHLQD